jgi:hypothetical protein
MIRYVFYVSTENTFKKIIITLLNTSYKIRYEYDSDSVVHKDGKKMPPCGRYVCLI